MFSINIFLPTFVSFALAIILSIVFIPILRKLKFGQYVRDEGPESHKKKSGTPTMGGIVIIITLAVVGLSFAINNKEALIVIFVTVSFGFVGFLDDFIKLHKKRSLGLRAWEKLFLEILISVIFIYLMLKFYPDVENIIIPFTNRNISIPLGSCFIPFSIITILGTVNGANFTDGLDGLLTGVTLVITVFLIVLTMRTYSDLFVVALIMLGILLAFLIFNTHPARVFMGDTGSLALGGFVVSMSLMLRIPLFILIFGIIYLVEILSVMLQVSYFKLTKGKRIFKMSPLHHHFELSGFEETRVVAVFVVITVIASILALAV